MLGIGASEILDHLYVLRFPHINIKNTAQTLREALNPAFVLVRAKQRQSWTVGRKDPDRRVGELGLLGLGLRFRRRVWLPQVRV